MTPNCLVPFTMLAAALAVACSGADTSETTPSSVTETKPISVLAASCSGCHAVGGSALVSLDGRTAEQLKESLLFYRNSEPGTTVMHRLARGYSEAELSDIANYLAAEAS